VKEVFQSGPRVAQDALPEMPWMTLAPGGRMWKVNIGGKSGAYSKAIHG
jgi:hypothetical protein